MMRKQIKGVYLNPKQKAFIMARQKRKAFKGGRGVGKTHVIGAHHYMLFRNLPTAKGILASITFEQLLSKTCPEMEDSWRDWNCHEWDPVSKTGHWVFGKRPPSHFVKPYKMPKSPERCYFFLNGHCIELASMEVNNKFRGGSYDFLTGDESALFKEEVWNKIFTISVRGRTRGTAAFHPERNYMHQSIVDVTSAPWTAEGKWIHKFREMAKKDPDNYFWIEAQTLDNIAYLGEKYIENLRRTLSPEEFYVEVLNGEIKRQSGGGYYPAFREDRHTTIDTWAYDWTSTGRIQTKRDTFIRDNQPFLLSMDFNVTFTCMAVCQEIQGPQTMELRFCDNLFAKPDSVKDPDGQMLIDRVIDEFCMRYAMHPVKSVELYGDATANNRRLGARPMFDQAVERFRHNGWLCLNRSVGKLPGHEMRHILINNILSKKNLRYPNISINSNKCKALILSIINAPIKADYSKDKTSESRKIPQEMATHLSDVFDYIICSKYAGIVIGSGDSIWTSLIPGRA